MHSLPFCGREQHERQEPDGEAGAAAAVEELLPLSDWEFPIINEGFKGKKYCFAYGYEFRSGNGWEETTMDDPSLPSASAELPPLRRAR